MNNDAPSPGTGNAAGPDSNSTAPQPMGIRQAFRQIRKGIVVMWWGFFDWVADVSWKALLLVLFLGLILGVGIFKLHNFTFLLVVAAFIIKVVAGGKRRAELTAREATTRAQTEQLGRAMLKVAKEGYSKHVLETVDICAITSYPEGLIRHVDSGCRFFG